MKDLRTLQKELEHELENDPKIKAAKRRLHMWLGSSTTMLALGAIAFAFFLFSRLGFSPWETLKLGLPPILGISAFLLAAWWLSVYTSRSAAQGPAPSDEQSETGE